MEFYAVTTTSLYRVSDGKGKDGSPIIERIKVRKSSFLPVGCRLAGGNLIGIARTRIILYERDYLKIATKSRQTSEDAGPNNWRDQTAPIIGLFFRIQEAEECLGFEDWRVCDERWQKQTEEVLEAIGDSHQVFIFSKYDPISFR